MELLGRNAEYLKVEELSTGYDPNPMQIAFHTAPHRYRFYGGAAGGGKTRALLEETLAQIGEAENKGIKLSAYFFRRTFPELENSVIKEFLNIIPTVGKRSVCRYNFSSHRAKFPRGSTLIFSFCADDNDVYKYQSAEFDLLVIDELTHFTEMQYKYLISRLRSTKLGVFPNFIGASNPGGVGHNWVKRIWIDKNFRENEVGEANEYIFIPAKIYDNKILMERDPDYVKRLEALPLNERRKLLDGDWDVFEGQFFSDWDARHHVVSPFEIPVGWLRYRTIDYGFRAPFACYWCAVDYDGKVWVYRELYSTERTAKENALAIVELSKGERYQYTTIDPSTFTRTHTGESIAEVLMQNGLENLVRADNERIGGWNSVREYMRVKDGYTKLGIFNSCVNMVRTVPELMYDKNAPDDLDTRMEDHAIDAARYLLHTLRNRKSHEVATGIEAKLLAIRERESSLVFNYDD